MADELSDPGPNLKAAQLEALDQDWAGRVRLKPAIYGLLLERSVLVDDAEVSQKSASRRHGHGFPLSVELARVGCEAIVHGRTSKWTSMIPGSSLRPTAVTRRPPAGRSSPSWSK